MLRLIYLLLAVLVVPASALAHATLTRAVPAPGSTVSVAPHDVVAAFSEAVEPSLSSIVVQDASGARVDTGEAHVLDGDAHQFAVSVKGLKPGAYTVIWKVTSVDTHKTQGRFTFTVKP